MTGKPILVPLADELKRAVRRRRRRGSLMRRGALVLLVGVFGSGAAGALALTGAFDPDRPTAPYGQQPPEPNLRYAKRPVVLARGARGAGKSFEVVGYQLARRDGAQPPNICLDIRLIPEGGGHGCLSPDRHFAGSSGGPSGITFEGAAEPDVSAVTVTYRRADGTSARRPALLARAENPRTLRAVGISEPFAIWRARLPSGARRVRARAYTTDGRPAWTAVNPAEEGERIGRALRKKRRHRSR